ncbi:hypothetical protein [Lewinella sp. LCG006]|uniref:hypothetical protein n=1 Tax=Lewinella sp. LCG006 TaxID=3231911 RepID=UPI0034601076
MKSLHFIFIVSALMFAFSCNSSSPESASAVQATEKTQSAPDISSRPPQVIEDFINNTDKAVSVASPLTEEQKMAITKLMEEANFQNLTRLAQREVRPGLRNTISTTILTTEQAAALDKYMEERRIRNQQRN